MRMDHEWADIRKMERQQAVDRANQLRRLESPRYKSLHSQMLLSAVHCVGFFRLLLIFLL